MKNLFILTVAIGMFLGTVHAQTNINVERIDNGTQQNTAPKFIGNTEISGEEIAKSNQSTSHIRSEFKPGYIGNIELCTALQFKYAMLMDTVVESITNLPLFSFIEGWWATRYKYGGDDHKGIDCSAFMSKLLAEVYGLNAPRTAKDQFAKCEKIATEDLVEGNLVFFNISGGVSHVGLYLGNGYFVHSSVNNGVTISSLTDEYYQKKFISGGRIMIQASPLVSR